jgi:hypothetical protein
LLEYLSNQKRAHSKKRRKMLMKKVAHLGLMFLFMLTLGACSGSKQSAVEGKLVDWNGKPVAGVKITASQAQPIKGYEQFEAVTTSNGAFRINGLFPSSQYVLKPWSDKWTCETAVMVDSAPQGETAVLPESMKIVKAYSKNGGGLVVDLATGATRFKVSSDGVITDSTTGLEWLAGPDRDTYYAQAEQWVAGCNVAGGNWRMPTRQELATLYQEGVGKRNMDPAFKTTGWWVWAEPRDSSSAWGFRFNFGLETYYGRTWTSDNRVFGVRSRPRG